MQYNRVLSNQIRVIAEQQDYFKTVSLGVWVQTGSAYETADCQGISHILEHMLFKGTKARSAREIADKIASIGDDVNAFTSKEYTSFYGTTLPEYLPVLTELLGDMLTNSVFREEDLLKEKDVIMDEIDMYNDSPEDMVHERLQKAVWEPHPLSFIISGEKETVQRVSREQLLAYMRHYYIGQNIIISVAGNFGEDLFELLEKSFGGIPAGDSAIGELTPATYHKEIIYIKKRIEQLHMNLVFDAIPSMDEQRYCMAVLNSALGGNNNSLLFQSIREELGLAYSVYSYTSTFRRSGLFHIDITVNPKQAFEVMEKVFEMIARVKREGFSEEELETHKNQVIIELIMGNETAKDIMSLNAKYISLYGSTAPVQKIVEQIRCVKKEDVIALAEKYLKPENAGLSLVGRLPGKEIQKIRKMMS